MTIKTLTILGSGTLGTQIAFQAALHGISVNIWNWHPERSHRRMKKFIPMFQHDLNLSDQQVEDAKNNIKMVTNDWTKPFKDTDLVIESVSEDLEVKEEVLKKLMNYISDDTIVASNSSTFMPSQLVRFVTHPERFLHIHFANHIWMFNTAEIVGTKYTKPETIQEVKDFAIKIGMLPIILKKENPGYIMNALSIPMLNSALWLWASGVADPITIDKDWINSTKMPMGPFMSLDMIGMRTAYAISAAQAKDNPAAKIIAEKLKEMIEQGRLGEESGRGFYEYPHPAFEDPNFLKP